MIASRPDDITAAVLAEAGRTPDPRQRELLVAAVRHLHAFARETRLTDRFHQIVSELNRELYRVMA